MPGALLGRPELLGAPALALSENLRWTGRSLLELVEPVIDQAILLHVHDNFGARPGSQRAGSIEPGRLDLHLAPGAGSIPWPALAPRLAQHGAPVELEVHPSQRPQAATLAILARELLGLEPSEAYASGA